MHSKLVASPRQEFKYGRTDQKKVAVPLEEVVLAQALIQRADVFEEAKQLKKKGQARTKAPRSA